MTVVSQSIIMDGSSGTSSNIVNDLLNNNNEDEDDVFNDNIINPPTRQELKSVLSYLLTRGFLSSYETLQDECGVTLDSASDPPEIETYRNVLSTAINDHFMLKNRNQVGFVGNNNTVNFSDYIIIPRHHVIRKTNSFDLDETSNPTCVRFLRKDRVLVGFASKKLKMYEITEDPVIFSLLDEFETNSPVLCIDICKNSNFFAVGCMGGEILIYKFSDLLHHVKTLTHHKNSRIMDVSFNSQSPTHLLLSLGRDKTVRVYDSENDFDLFAYIEFPQPVFAAKWISKTEFCVTLENTAFVYIYDIADVCQTTKVLSKSSSKFTVNDRPQDTYFYFNLTELAVSPCFRFLFGIHNNIINMYSLEHRLYVRSFYGLNVGQYDFVDLKFSSCGGYLYASQSIGKIKIWNILNGREITDITCHLKNNVRSFDVWTHSPITSEESTENLLLDEKNEKVVTVSFEKKLCLLV